MPRRKALILGLLLALSWPAAHLAYTVADGLHDAGESADAAVVLGSRVNPDGTLSARLEQRLRCGLGLYRAHRVPKIIVSGGLGREGYFEGDKMRDYLQQHGVPAAAIITDNHGNNTLATVRNVLHMRDSLRFNKLLIVSQYFHLTRTKKLFRQHHFPAVSSVSPRYFELRDAYALPREFIAYYAE